MLKSKECCLSLLSSFLFNLSSCTGDIELDIHGHEILWIIWSIILGKIIKQSGVIDSLKEEFPQLIE